MEFVINVLVHTLVSAGMLYVASRMIEGVDIDNATAAIVGAVVLGGVNWVVWTFLAPILMPLTILTLGLFALVVNAVALMFTASVVRGFGISSFGKALMAAVAIALMNLLLGIFFG